MFDQNMHIYYIRNMYVCDVWVVYALICVSYRFYAYKNIHMYCMFFLPQEDILIIFDVTCKNSCIFWCFVLI